MRQVSATPQPFRHSAGLAYDHCCRRPVHSINCRVSLRFSSPMRSVITGSVAFSAPCCIALLLLPQRVRHQQGDMHRQAHKKHLKFCRCSFAAGVSPQCQVTRCRSAVLVATCHQHKHPPPAPNPAFPTPTMSSATILWDLRMPTAL